jgi:signal transduction histidine kinase
MADLSGAQDISSGGELNRKMQLLSSVTRHDLLNKIGCVEALIEGHLIEHVQDHQYEKNLMNALDILVQIEQFLAYIREYELTGLLAPQWIDLHEALKPGITRIPENITVRVTLPEIEVFADALLNRAFYNLLDNTVIHGKHVSMVQISGIMDENFLKIILEDDGKGIPAIDKEKIFELGYGKNTGFGLFFIKEVFAITHITIIEGGIFGIGARFEISIPQQMWRNKGNNLPITG